MPTDKRSRQKAGRVSRLEEQRAAEIRDHRRRRITRIVLAVAAVLAFAFVVSLLTKDDTSDVATDDTSGTTAPSTEPTEPGETTSSTYSDQAIADEVLARTRPDPAPPAADLAKDALVITVEIEGTGRVVEATDTVTAHYVGVLADGTVFDESWARGEPSPFSLTGVIPGWTEGLAGQKVGSRVHLAIGSDKAYGPEGNPNGGIPPDAPMAFTVDIVDAVPAAG